MGKGQITVRDVAKRAGVAVSSVSRVLNGHPDVSEAMRSRINAAIEALDFQPDYLAQSLRRGSSMSVGFLVRDIANPLFAEIVQGSVATLREAGFSTLLTNSSGDPSLDVEHISLLTRRQVDGLILSLESETYSPTLAALGQVRGPLVLLDREVPSVHASSVLSDHYLGVREATLDMLRRPSPRIAYIGGSEDVRASRERMRGYLDVDAALDIPIEPDLIKAGSYSADFAYESATEMLKRNPCPTGVLAGGAQLAQGALKSIRDADALIGVEVDFVGCDGSPLMQIFDPPLNIIERDANQLGSVAAELLLARLIEKEEPKVVRLPTSYVKRDSVRRRLPETGR